MKRLAAILLFMLVILIPLFLIWAWGLHLAGDAYLLLHYAKALAGGSSVIFAAAVEATVASSPSLLFTLMVGALAMLGIDPATAAAALSALGWSATAFAFLAVGKGINRIPGSVVSALLLCFNPLIITSSGTAASWVVASAWWAIALFLHKRYVLTIAAITALALLLLPLPPWPVLSLANGISAWQPTLAGAFAWSFLLFLVGIGAGIAAGWLGANVDAAGNSAAIPGLVSTGTLVVIFVLAGGYQLSVLNDLFQTRPEARWALEDDIAAWIGENSAANAVIGAGAKVGYLANRRTVPLAASAAPQTARALEEQLMARPPSYLVANDTLPWQLLENSRWFRLNYQARAEFDDPYVAEAPYTIWQYQPPAPDLGFAHALNARVPNRLRFLGYQVNQENDQATGEVIMTLYLEAAANTSEPTTQFSLKTRLLSPVDGRTLAEWDFVLPNSIAPEMWRAGDRIMEQIRIEAPPDLEPGAYPLNISLWGPAPVTGAEGAEFWPISLENDIERLDRLPVGYLVVPTAVDLSAVQSREATFGDKIKLLGYSASDLQPGDALELTLFWEVSDSLEGEIAPLHVFTHVLDSGGQLVAGHDGIPANGRYPTPSWLPGMTIADAHVIQLPPDLPAGDYEIRVGLYEPESGERLPVLAADGSVPPDNAFPLTAYHRE